MTVLPEGAQADWPDNQSPDILLQVCSRAHPHIMYRRSAADRKALQRVVKSAQEIIGRRFSTIRDIYDSRCRNRAAHITKDPSYLPNRLFIFPPFRNKAAQYPAQTY